MIPATRLCQVNRTIAVMLLSLALVIGCATQLSITNRESIRTVSINKNIKIPDEIYYYGLGHGVGGALSGLIGQAIADVAAQGTKAQIKTAMQEGHIDLAQIVREQFETELVAARIFPSIIPEGGDAEVRLEIGMFGFAQIFGDILSNQMKPMLTINGSLVRTDGTIIWKKSSYVINATKQTPSHTLEEYLQNPQLMREAFTVAAKIASAELVKHMQNS